MNESDPAPAPRKYRRAAVIAGSVAVVSGVLLGGVALVRAPADHDDPTPLFSDETGIGPTVAAVPPSNPPEVSPSPSATGRTTNGPARKTTSEPAREPASTARPSGPISSKKTGSPADRSTPATQSEKTTTPAAVDPSVNLAASKAVSESSHTQDYAAAHITDGDVNSYWEAASGFPQSITVDLGRARVVGRLELALPPVADWNRRTQTISISGSRDGSSWVRLRSGRGYVFDANSAARNATGVSFTPAPVRYLKLTFSANDGWPAAQLSELTAHSS